MSFMVMVAACPVFGKPFCRFGCDSKPEVAPPSVGTSRVPTEGGALPSVV
jgi:hypothetical protein